MARSELTAGYRSSVEPLFLAGGGGVYDCVDQTVAVDGGVEAWARRCAAADAVRQPRVELRDVVRRVCRGVFRHERYFAGIGNSASFVPLPRAPCNDSSCRCIDPPVVEASTRSPSVPWISNRNSVPRVIPPRIWNDTTAPLCKMPLTASWSGEVNATSP